MAVDSKYRKNRQPTMSNAIAHRLTLPGDVEHSTAASIVQCYGYLIRRDKRWLLNLPASLQAEIELLIGANNTHEDSTDNMPCDSTLHGMQTVTTSATGYRQIQETIEFEV